METIALKRFKLDGVTYKAGDPVDASRYNDVKLGQLFNQRMIRPKPLETPVAKQQAGEKER